MNFWQTAFVILLIFITLCAGYLWGYYEAWKDSNNG